MRIFHWLYERAVDRPWGTLLILLLATVGMASFISQMKSQSDFVKFLDRSDPAAQALDRAEAIYGSQELEFVVIRSDRTIFQTTTLKKIQEMERQFEEIPGVDDVQGPTNSDVIRATGDLLIVEPAAEVIPETPEELAAYQQKVLGDNRLRGLIVSEDGRAAAIVVKINPHLDDKKSVTRQIERLAHEFNRGPEEIVAVGSQSVDDAIQKNMHRDLMVLFPLCVLLILGTLFVTLRSLRGVLIPLSLVLIALVWTLGTMALAGSPFTPFATMLPIILVAMGVADSIHVLHRFYEDVQENGKAKREIILRTMGEMTAPVVMTTLTTMAGFLSLMFTFMWPQRAFGVFTAVGMLYEMILSLTFIPALLSLLPLPNVRAGFARGIAARFLSRFAAVVEQRAGYVLTLTLVLLVGIAVVVPKIRVESSATVFLGPDHPVVQALNLADESLGGSFQILIEVDTGRANGLKDPALLTRIVALQEFLESQDHMGKSLSVADVVRTMNQKFHGDDPGFYVVPDDPRLIAQLLALFTFQGGSLDNLATADFSKGEVIARIQNTNSSELQRVTQAVQAYIDANFPDVKAERVGTERVFVTMLTKMIPNQVNSLTASTLSAGALVTLLMGSWVAGLISLIPLLFAVLGSLALMALFDLPLDLATVMVSSIAIGVGIDFAIHFIHRFRREMQGNGNYTHAFKQTMKTAGQSIVFNMLTVAIGFAILLLSNFRGLANFGLLITLTMFTSALATFTIIPSLLLLFKPAFVRRHTTANKTATRALPAVSENIELR
jgi:hydrophobe/amphiphile efflux-3 (HAE3) family protein